MINFDDYKNENKTEQFKLAPYSGSSTKNTYCRSLKDEEKQMYYLI